MQEAAPLGTKVPPSGDARQGEGAPRGETLADISGLNGSSGAALAKLRRVAVAANRRTTDMQLERWLTKTVAEHGAAKTLKGLDDLLAYAEGGGEVSNIPRALDAYAKGARLNGKGGRSKGSAASSSAIDPRDDCETIHAFVAYMIERSPGEADYVAAQAQLASGVVGNELRELQELYEKKRG